MKKRVLTCTLSLLAIIFLASCGEKDADVRDRARQSVKTITPSTTVTDATTTAGTVNNNGVPHYQCPNKCTGGIGDAKGPCPVCGTEMDHNQAFHAQTPTNLSTSEETSPSELLLDPAAPNANTITPQTVTPAQNAAGVYHYICPKGHAGGSGSKGTCAECGAALEHNEAYHASSSVATTTTPTPNPSTTVTPQASPAQNANGEYHYTCPNGHPGAGSKGNCSQCGAALEHNQAYHNN